MMTHEREHLLEPTVPSKQSAWQRDRALPSTGEIIDVALQPDFEEDLEVLWRQELKVEGPDHFGNRIVFSPDGNIFLAVGERFQFGPAQESSNTLGTVV